MTATVTKEYTTAEIIAWLESPAGQQWSRNAHPVPGTDETEEEYTAYSFGVFADLKSVSGFHDDAEWRRRGDSNWWPSAKEAEAEKRSPPVPPEHV